VYNTGTPPTVHFLN